MNTTLYKSRRGEAFLVLIWTFVFISSVLLITTHFMGQRRAAVRNAQSAFRDILKASDAANQDQGFPRSLKEQEGRHHIAVTIDKSDSLTLSQRFLKRKDEKFRISHEHCADSHEMIDETDACVSLVTRRKYQKHEDVALKFFERGQVH